MRQATLHSLDNKHHIHINRKDNVCIEIVNRITGKYLIINVLELVPSFRTQESFVQDEGELGFTALFIKSDNKEF